VIGINTQNQLPFIPQSSSHAVSHPSAAQRSRASV
jgi:hypothetical protein